MKKGQKLWTRDELILAMNLYLKLPFGKIHSTNPDVIHLAKLIERTPSSVSLKLSNLASFDSSLKARGIKGAVNASKLDAQIWHEFSLNWNNLPYESEKLLARLEHRSIEQLNHISEAALNKEGKTSEQMVKVRVNQSLFRSTVLAAYNNTCCITGLKHPELLIAGHIKPWSIDEKNRLNPQNGIALNALHDKAFETGLITITPSFRVKVSKELFKDKNSKAIQQNFLIYENMQIIMPSKFIPNIEFLQYHNDNRFRK
ncbi:HNH endonuclease [Pedobacter sp. BMA]|uniref:HNH endonuclease n=1 Tax=Pedobacter sp. BMA TaxID=1663685 RepID=UPI00064ADD0F|nr:HNH endonuclease [Pedobacter sp. BMA]KLT64738.1 restriction endonuclease [Pedobacter sp. BMA]